MKKIIINFIFFYLSLNAMNSTEYEDQSERLTQNDINEKVLTQNYPNIRALLCGTIKKLLEYEFKKIDGPKKSTKNSTDIANKRELKKIKKKLI